MRLITALLAVGLLPCFTGNAQAPFRTNSVSIFKNGSAFFLKEATVKTNNNQYFLNTGAPQAAFGTLWFSSPTGGITEVKTYTQETSHPKERKNSFHSSSFNDMLQANLNKSVTIFDLDEHAIKGSIEKVDGDYFLLNSGGKWVNMAVNRIKRIEFEEKPIYPDSISITRDTVVEVKRGVLIDFKSKNIDQQLEMMYLQKGIGWVPTYHIDLKQEDKATLKLQAEVVNNAEDITNTDVNFVIGVPNFIHENQLSPLSQSMEFDRFLSSLQNTNQSGQLDFANRGGGRIAYGIDLESATDSDSDVSSITGSTTEDLFFYTLNKVTLKKGDRALFTIMETELPIKHIYEVRLNENTIDHYYGHSRQSDAFSFEADFKNKVWHTLKLKNATSTPFTAGSVIVTKSHKGETRPISQDKITYTSPGGETFLKLTAAPDVSVKDAEKVVSREERTEKIEGYDYDLVTIAGEIRVKNYKNQQIDLNIRRKVTGALKTSAPNWLTAAHPPAHKQINETTDVCWELNLKAGAEKVVKYQYTILVRSR